MFFGNEIKAMMNWRLVSGHKEPPRLCALMLPLSCFGITKGRKTPKTLQKKRKRKSTVTPIILLYTKRKKDSQKIKEKEKERKQEDEGFV